MTIPKRYLEAAKELVSNAELLNEIKKSGDELVEFALLAIEIARISLKYEDPFINVTKTLKLASWLWECVANTYPEWRARLQNKIAQKLIGVITLYAIKRRKP